MTIDPKLALTDEDRAVARKIYREGGFINEAADAAHASWLKRQPPQGTPLTLDDDFKFELTQIVSHWFQTPESKKSLVHTILDWLRTKTLPAPAQPRKWTQKDHATVEATLDRATNAPFDHSDIASMILNDLAPPAQPTFTDEQLEAMTAVLGAYVGVDQDELLRIVRKMLSAAKAASPSERASALRAELAQHEAAAEAARKRLAELEAGR